MDANGVKAGQLFAVKSVSAETLHKHGLDVAAVKKEVDVLTRLSHPHIVRFIKFMSETRKSTNDDGEVCDVVEHHLIMELAEGGSLAEVIKGKPGPVPAQVVATPNTVPFVSIGVWFQPGSTFLLVHHVLRSTVLFKVRERTALPNAQTPFQTPQGRQGCVPSRG